MNKYFPVFILLLSLYQHVSGQSLGKTIAVYCNERQNSYVKFAEKIEIVDVSNHEIIVNIIDNNTVSFKLANPFVRSFPINGIVNTTNLTSYPLEIIRKDTLSINESVQFVSSQNQSTETANSLSSNNESLMVNENDMMKNAKIAMNLKDKVANVGQKKNKISSKLNLIAVDSKYVYVKTAISNKSAIDYKVDFFGLLVKTKNNLKIVGQNEDYIKPHFVFNEQNIIKSGDILKIVLVYELFTLKDNQELTFFMKELNGGRDLSFAIKSSVLLKSAYNLE